jgi:hypothetical protein
MLKKKYNIPDSVLDTTAKMGIHPHHLTQEQVLAALADGTIDRNECDGLLWWLDKNGVETDERVN